MESFSQPPYPDSRGSSPRSRDIDSENQLWDETPPPPAASYKVKLMCSYRGKIKPRLHDNRLAYMGGDTKILAVDRNIKFSAVIAKLSSLCDLPHGVLSLKYQLPGEDLDALVSVTNDEDLELMMVEYDRLLRTTAKPSRLRLFLFPFNLPTVSAVASEPKSERQWFVDALNSVPVQSLDSSSPPSVSAMNPDSLLGLDKGYVASVSAPKFQDSASPPQRAIPDSAVVKDVSDCGSEDRHVIGEPMVSPSEIQRQIHELQRLQMAACHDQRKLEEGNVGMAYAAEAYNAQKVPEKLAPPPPGVVPVPMQIPSTGYMTLPGRHVIVGGYSVVAAPTQTEQQPVYIIRAAAGGVYNSPPGLPPVTGPAGGQAYYGVPRMVQEAYREEPVYNQMPTTASFQQQPKPGAYAEGIHVRQPKAGPREQGYIHLGYDSTGKQVYGVLSQYQAVTAPVAVEGRQGGGSGVAANQ